MAKFWHKASMGAYSGVVGAPILLLDAVGKHVGQLALISVGDARKPWDKAEYLSAVQAVVDHLNSNGAA